MNTKESPEVCLHTAYVIVWEDVTIKAVFIIVIKITTTSVI